jgi:hypothetical protein
MGMEHKVTYHQGTVPVWSHVHDLLVKRGFAAEIRMIDGELAYPDEAPPESWRELRVGTPQGMVTVRRGTDHVLLVTWGNADAAMRQAWNALAWAYAEISDGRVVSDRGELTAAEFAGGVELPPSFRT